MKLLALAIASLLTISASAQNSANFCLQTNCSISQQLPKDSAQLISLATVPGDSVISYSWTQLSGPAASVIVSATSQNTLVRKLAVGTYEYGLTVKTKNGNVLTIRNDFVVVTPAPAPPRTVVGVSWTLVNGVWTAKFTFNDGTVQ